MPIIFLASFPDSRNYPRPSTKVADNLAGTIIAGGVTKILDGDENTTYATLRSNSATETIFILYVNVGDPAPLYGDIFTRGMIVQAYDGYEIESKQDVYATSVAVNVDYRIDNGKG
jgi:hypothetical protein